MLLHRALVLDSLRALVNWGLAARGRPDLDPDLFARAVQTLFDTAARALLDDPAHFSVTSFTLFARTVLAALRPL